jgi:hypothetical protein
MPFAYYDRLAPARKAVYRRSDAIVELLPPRGVDAGATVVALRAALAADRRGDLERTCQALCGALTAGYAVPPVRVVVLERRPSDDYGELHGLYEPAEGRRHARISVWMRTAARQQVVAYRSFLRTLVHELGHHLDYELYALEESFHTEGFYKRESSLAGALFAQGEAHAAAAGS